MSNRWLGAAGGAQIAPEIVGGAGAILAGAVAALANTVTGIFTPTQGWQTVNNSNPATLGVAVESDAELRVRQSVSVADPSLTVFEGTVGSVENVTGVTKTMGYENPTNSTDKPNRRHTWASPSGACLQAVAAASVATQSIARDAGRRWPHP